MGESEKMDIRNKLLSIQDEKYRDFSARLIPSISKERIIGIRIPLIRSFAKEMSKDEALKYIQSCEHFYLEEFMLHSFIVAAIRDFDTCIYETEKLLPYIDSWSLCDSFSPRIFKKNKEKLLIYIEKWLKSEHTYTVRFALKMLMEHFLDEAFDEKYLEYAANIKSDEYYLKMMVAWYFATAAAKQYEFVLPYIENYRLDATTHKMTVRKIFDSYRITDAQKDYIRTFSKYPEKA